jgi:hypothetical protein
VCALSAKQSKPTEETLKAVDHLLGYVKAHPDNGELYRKSDMQLKYYSDASFASQPLGRSVAGGFHYMGNKDNNEICAVIDAFSVNIGVVVASAYEAEVAAVYLNMQRASWLRHVLNAFGHPQGPTQGVTDNAVAVAFANDTCKLSKSKSIDIRFHWVRDRVQQKQQQIGFVPGDLNIADFFTKPLSKDDHHRWLPLIVDLPARGAFTPDVQRKSWV